MVKPELIAIDGTRMAGNASHEASRDFDEIAREVLAEHKARDEAEGEQLGEARGDELPEQLRTPEGRREFFRKASQKQRDEAGTDELGEAEPEASSEPEYEFDSEQIIARTEGMVT